ncbi:PD-(D/E)XK nuclease family protein [Helicobacter sp. 11S02629-2]|uniref:PD-(D/E)XK nuclease family protein n=1 Tax=Helicobacter sp. 11S02629-2 TaxID=1476195 RepID=UPI001179CD8C|nr:PD-(D/E)XK nuclease family protein [Helicobacter sp. 11S02629-2]
MSAFYTHFIKSKLYKQDLSLTNFKLFEYENLETTNLNSFLPQTVLLGEFFKKVAYAPLPEIPKSLRNFLLADALYKLGKSKSSKLCGFEYSFISYLENSDVLLNFLDEIRSHKLSLKDLKNIALSDVYGDYTLHLEIVEEVYKNYQEALTRLSLSDGIYEGYTLLTSYIDSFENFHIELEGFITPLELEILQKIASKKNVFLYFETDRFNINHFKFIPHKLEVNYKYAYNLRTTKLDSKKSTLDTSFKNVSLFSASSEVHQVAFCLEEAYSWLKEIKEEGTSENDYAIILCNEDFTRHLEVYDDERIFNFARGRELTSTKAFLYFEELCADFLSLEKEDGLFKHKFYDKEVKDSIFDFNIKSLEVLLQNLFEGEILKQAIDVLSELNALFKILKNTNFNLLLKRFIDKLLTLRLSDVNGGPIKVIGVLETRNIKLKKALLVDFSTNFVPNVNSQDLFLNSRLRALNKIPTIEDKQNLQKHHYLGIFHNAKDLKVSFLQNDESMGSLMLEELGLETKEAKDLSYLNVLDLNSKDSLTYIKDEFKAYKYTHISASSLKTYKDCTRKFYYRYIEDLRQEAGESLKAGINIHAALEECFLDLKTKDNIDAKKIKETLESKLDIGHLESIDEFETKKYLFFMQNFFTLEAKRFQEGIEILALEKEFCGSLLDKEVSGKIDRIDRLGDTLRIIDYKLSKNTKQDPFQLAFYSLCIEHLECLKEYKNYNLEFYYYILLDSKTTYQEVPAYVIEAYKEMIVTCIKELGTKNIPIFEDEKSWESNKALRLKLAYAAKGKAPKDVITNDDKGLKSCDYCEFQELCGI